MISSIKIPGKIPDNRFGDVITTIDSHTEGEGTRLIVDGLGNIPGITMTEKLNYFKTHHDDVRCFLTRAPRGGEILAAMVTDNVTPEAAFGLLYMDAKRYPYLCGHATIGAVVTLAQFGYLKLKEGNNVIGVDTPSGLMTVEVTCQEQEVVSVAMDMVPSFVYDTAKEITVEGFGKLCIDLVCTGGFFAMVDTEQLNLSPVLENKNVLVDLGMKIIDAANEQLKVVHPVRWDVTTVDVTEFYESTNETPATGGRGMVIYGESHMDQSPCGTGTAAKLTLLHHYGKIGMHQPYINASPLGTTFEASLVDKTCIGDLEAMVTRIKGRAWVTGIHHFVMDKTDPFKQGFII
ncbi:proline racemase [Desulfocicer vacuolatum DSM 3385]|uniref:Proline racemase n=1 Tax=Desulfocicer vacuolatum DSM 3385 TaxID=1121400 RepID=A0A1W2E438_9BACT|nr:proline racemase family protein [Desulfocicer vacuolatum]SMD04465.1 proline racemase [Desulfocicer vacuolatum DSM 3385]